MARYPRPAHSKAQRSLTSGQLKVLQAVAVILENAATRVTIANIAKEIHVTEGAIYRHFRSKEDIFEAIFTYIEANMLTPLATAQEQTPDIQRRAELIFNALNDFFEGHPGFSRLVLGSGTADIPRMAEKIQILNGKLRAEFVHMFKAGQDGTLFSLRKDLSPEQASEIFYGVLIGTAMAQAHGLPQLESAARWKALRASLFQQ